MAASLSFDTASRHVKRGELAHVYYLTGDEDILKDELVSQIVDRAVEPASRDFNVDVRAAGDLDGESLHTLLETPPMLAKRRVVVVKGVEQWRKNAKLWQVLQRYLGNPSPTTVLVLLHGAGEQPNRTLVAESTHVEARPLNPDRVLKWVHWRAALAGFSLTPEAAQHLVRSVGGDLAVLTAEIAKLAAVTVPDTPVGASEVAALVGIKRGETTRDWVQAALSREIPRAVEMLETVLAGGGVTGVRLIMEFGTALIGVRLALALADGGLAPGRIERAVLGHIRAARPPGLGSWRDEARAWTRCAERWSAAELDAAIRAAYAADQALKSSTIADDRGILAGMLMAFGARRAAA